MLVVAGRRDRTESLPGGMMRHEFQWVVPKIEGLPSTSSLRPIPLGKEELGLGAGPMDLGVGQNSYSPSFSQNWIKRLWLLNLCVVRAELLLFISILI